MSTSIVEDLVHTIFSNFILWFIHFWRWRLTRHCLPYSTTYKT